MKAITLLGLLCLVCVITADHLDDDFEDEDYDDDYEEDIGAFSSRRQRGGRRAGSFSALRNEEAPAPRFAPAGLFSRDPNEAFSFGHRLSAALAQAIPETGLPFAAGPPATQEAAQAPQSFPKPQTPLYPSAAEPQPAPAATAPATVPATVYRGVYRGASKGLADTTPTLPVTFPTAADFSAYLKIFLFLSDLLDLIIVMLRAGVGISEISVLDDYIVNIIKAINVSILNGSTVNILSIADILNGSTIG